MKLRLATILFAAAVCAVTDTALQAWFMKTEYTSWLKGRDYLATVQVERHRAVMDHTAANPWRYRVLADWAVEGALRATHAVHPGVSERDVFLGVRAALNAAVFVLLAAWLGRLGFSAGASLLGLALAAYAMSWSYWSADLTPASCLDMAFYLAGGWLCLSGRAVWLPAIMIPAALNRETAALLAVLPAALLGLDRRTAWIGVGAALVFGAVFFGMRWAWGWPPCMQSEVIGANLLTENLSANSLIKQAATVSAVPVTALFGWRRAPSALRRLFWALVPAWLGVHYSMCYVAETRNLLVPFYMVVVPLALFSVQTHPLELEMKGKIHV